jgi:hypothetical protein
MTPILAAAALATSPGAPPPTMDQIEVVTRAPVVGTLKEGVQAYRQEFFTSVRPGTALDMVQWLPGFTFEDVRDVRGLAGAIGNVLIDGQPPTSKNDTLSTVLRRIPASQVDRIDIIVGGAPGIDMRGRSVIANVILKKTPALRGSVTAQATRLRDGRVMGEVLASLSRKTETHGIEGSLTLAKRAVNGDGVGRGSLVRTDPAGRILFAGRSVIRGQFDFATGTAAYEFPAAGGKLRFNGAFTYVNGLATEATDVTGLPALYESRLTEHTGQMEAGARYTRPFGRSTLESQLLQRFNVHEATTAASRFPVLSDLAVNDTAAESIARLSWRFKRDDTLSSELSAEGALNDFDTRSDYFEGGVARRLPSGDVDISERRGDLGGLVAWKPNAAHSLTGALRVETSTLTSARDVVLERSFTYVKPRLVYAWTADGKTQLRLRLEHEVGQVQFGAFVASVQVDSGLVRTGNPDLRPQRNWVGEAVLERQFWTGASVVLTARRRRIEDVVEYRILPQFGGAIALSNIGAADQTDLAATVTLPLRRLGLDGVSLKGGTTWLWSRVTDPTTGVKRRLSGQVPLVADVHLIHDLPRWKLNWGVDAAYSGGGRSVRPNVVVDFDDYVRLSAFVERRFGSDLVLRVEGLNLLNPRPLWSTENYGGPRNLSPLSYTDQRRNGEGRTILVRLRRTIG